jgi:hypothetical protein
MLLASLLLAAAAAPTSHVSLEWRALAFSYVDRKYERVIDMFDRGFTNQADCMAAVAEGVAAVRPNLKEGDGIIGACVQVPVLQTP